MLLTLIFHYQSYCHIQKPLEPTTNFLRKTLTIFHSCHVHLAIPQGKTSRFDRPLPGKVLQMMQVRTKGRFMIAEMWRLMLRTLAYCEESALSYIYSFYSIMLLNLKSKALNDAYLCSSICLSTTSGKVAVLQF